MYIKKIKNSIKKIKNPFEEAPFEDFFSKFDFFNYLDKMDEFREK